MIRASYSKKPLILDILTKAFDTNKSVNYVVKQDKKRIQRIRKLMDYSFELCHDSGEIYLTPDEKGVALIFLPYKKKTSLKSVWRDIVIALCVIGITRIMKVLRREQYINKIRPRDINYMYFWFFAVDPLYQGNGAAKHIKDGIFKISDERNMPIYVETSGEKQKNVYRNYGFEIYHTWTQKDYTLYFMKRQPKKNCI